VGGGFEGEEGVMCKGGGVVGCSGLGGEEGKERGRGGLENGLQRWARRGGGEKRKKTTIRKRKKPARAAKDFIRNLTSLIRERI